jgi:hypothetical protein
MEPYNTQSMDTPPPYHHVVMAEDVPPTYTPSVHHLSLVYYSDEMSQITSNVIQSQKPHTRPAFMPLLCEINSTQLNLYQLKPTYAKCIAHIFNDLNPNFVDPNLNIKSKSPPKNNFVGQGIGASKNLFTMGDFNSLGGAISSKLTRSRSGSNASDFDQPPARPTPLLTKESCSSLSTMFSSNVSITSTSSRATSIAPTVTRTTSSSFTRLFDKLSLKKPKDADDSEFSSYDSYPRDYSMMFLSEMEKRSQDMLYAQKLLNYKPDINAVFDTEYTSQDAQLLNLKFKLFKSFSLQELVKFGNASDFLFKPYALRLMFPNEQFVLVSYNPNVYATLFYKLNVGRELSFDLDVRVAYPVDYCVPRRNRRRRNRRNRSDSSASTLTTTTTSTAASLTGNQRAATNGGRSRSNSLLNDNDDGDDDELDTTFNIIETNDNTMEYQPQPSIQPQVILEDEILNDIIQLEPTQEIISSMSNVSRITTSSVFSLMERRASQVTDYSVTSSLSAVSLHDSSDNSASDTGIAELSLIEKIPTEVFPQSRYKELVFSVRCVKSCKNQTVPWYS